MNVRVAGALMVLGLLVGCVQAPQANPRVAWTDVTPAGVLPASLAVAGTGLLVTGSDSSGERPAVVRADGTAVPLEPTEPYAASADIVAASPAGGRLYLLGGRSGGAHGNVRWTVWDGALSGPVTSHEQEFFTFGGHDAGPLLGVVVVGTTPIIVGSRGADTGPMAALYGVTGVVWKQLDTPAALQSGTDGILGFTAVAASRDRVVIVGDVVRPGSSGAVQTPALFYGTVGGAWHRVDLPAPELTTPGLRHATGVACDDDACWVAGWSGRPVAWRVSLDDASVQTTPDLDGTAPADTDPVAVVTLVGGRPLVMANASSPTASVLCGHRWVTFPAPTAVTAAAAIGADAYLVAGTTPRLWQAQMPSC